MAGDAGKQVDREAGRKTLQAGRQVRAGGHTELAGRHVFRQEVIMYFSITIFHDFAKPSDGFINLTEGAFKYVQ